MTQSIRTIRDLYHSLPENIAYACLGKYYYKWSPECVPEDEKSLCVNLNDVLNNLGYELVDPSVSGEYNDIQRYMNCLIREI